MNKKREKNMKEKLLYRIIGLFKYVCFCYKVFKSGVFFRKSCKNLMEVITLYVEENQREIPDKQYMGRSVSSSVRLLRALTEEYKEHLFDSTIMQYLEVLQAEVMTRGRRYGRKPF